MDIFLVRHFESEKNTGERFSYSDSEHLTDKGRKECIDFSKAFQAFCNEQNFNISEIHITDSIRSRETASIVSSYLSIDNLFFHSELKSTNAGHLAGKSLIEAKQLDPSFYKMYYLYRKGLFNSYSFDLLWDDPSKESKMDFEKRVLDCFYGILSDANKQSALLFIAHRASITAILINVARSMGIYTQDFYGSLDSNPGTLSWISYDGEKWDINLVSSPFTEAAQWREYCFGQE